MTRHLFLSILGLSLSIFCRPALAREGVTLDPAREAAILPDAGFVAHIDVAGLRDSELVKSLLSNEGNEAIDRLTSVTGLSANDVVDVLVSARSDGIEVDPTQDGQRLSRVPGIMAISLARPVGAAELRAGLEARWQGQRDVSGSKLVEVEIVEVTGPDAPALYAAASRSGRVVFLTSDRPTLASALERERDSSYSSVSPALEVLESSLAPGRLADFVLLTPPALRDRLQSSGAAEGRAANMADRIFEPFRGLRGLALGVSVTGHARLELLGELGDEASARRAEELLGGFLLPNLLGVLSARLGVAELPRDAVVAASTGSFARVSIRMRPEDVEALLAARTAAEPEPSPK